MALLSGRNIPDSVFNRNFRLTGFGSSTCIQWWVFDWSVSRGHGDHGDHGGCVGHGCRVGHGGRGGYGGLVVREGFQKSKWFKMDFAIRRRTPPSLNGTSFQSFFTPIFFFCN